MKRLIFLFLFIFVLMAGILLVAPEFVVAQDCPEGQTCLDNPLKFLGVTTPEGVVEASLKGFAGLIALIAVAFIVFNGFKLIVAGGAEPGKDEKINTAKRGLAWSVGGFIAAILAYTLVSGTAQFLGFDPSKIGQDEIMGSPVQSGDFIEVMLFVMKNFLGIVGFATTLVIIYYGYSYIVSAGNEDAVKRAKDGLKWTIFGFIITILAYTIISGVQQIFFGSVN